MNDDMMNGTQSKFKGKVATFTDATIGIGVDIARGLATADARVIRNDIGEQATSGTVAQISYTDSLSTAVLSNASETHIRQKMAIIGRG